MMQHKNSKYYFEPKDVKVAEFNATHLSVFHGGLYAEKLNISISLELTKMSDSELEDMVRKSPYVKTGSAVVIEHEDEGYFVIVYFNFITYFGDEVNDIDVVSSYSYPSFNSCSGKHSQYHDIIGDIHANADKLEKLLKSLGYQRKFGVYCCDRRHAVFLGDFIDRGDYHKRVIDIVRPMVEMGYASAVMGNHEFNAIGYHTVGADGKPLREHSTSNQKQHQDFLLEYPIGHAETVSVINWFKTLPLFLNGEGYRVIHACWDPDHIKKIKTMLSKTNQIKEEYIEEAFQKGSTLYDATETLMKGVEMELPIDITFRDLTGKIRNMVRVKWWTPPEQVENYAQIALVEDVVKESLMDIKMVGDNKSLGYPDNVPPVFIGHYQLTGEPEPLTSRVVCVDYSGREDKALVSYEWDQAKRPFVNGVLERANFKLSN
ncbi:metallophosphoesterase [Brumicola pallidula]|nr:metallophosphoesterase [Glaciecola pallidula]